MPEALKQVSYTDFFGIDKDEFIGNVKRKCAECDLEFGTVGVYEQHLSKIHKLPALEDCSHCNTSFKRRMGLITHFRQMHLLQSFKGDPTKRALGCDLCDAFLVINGFTSVEALEKHTKEVHGESTPINTPENHGKSFCPICAGDFAYRKGMIEHLQVIHGDHLIRDMLYISGKEMEKLVEERRFKCKYCARLFTVKKSLVQHLERIHYDFEGYESASTTCNMPQSPTFKRKTKPPSGPSLSADRLKRKIKKPNRISLDATFMSSADSSKTRNELNLRAPGDFRCEECNRTFTRASVLKVHMQMIHGDVKTEPEDEFDQEISFNNAEKNGSSKKRKKPADEQKVEDLYEKPGEDNGPFYNDDELKSVLKEKHQDFFDDSVPCHETADPAEDREPCLIETCERQFLSYFSMMRHVAFFHRPEKTVASMKLRVLKRKVDAPAGIFKKPKAAKDPLSNGVEENKTGEDTAANVVAEPEVKVEEMEVDVKQENVEPDDEIAAEVNEDASNPSITLDNGKDAVELNGDGSDNNVDEVITDEIEISEKKASEKEKSIVAEEPQPEPLTNGNGQEES